MIPSSAFGNNSQPKRKNMPQNRVRQLCPVCRANPELSKVCTVCLGKDEVEIETEGNNVTIYPLDSTVPTFSGPWTKHGDDISISSRTEP